MNDAGRLAGQQGAGFRAAIGARGRCLRCKEVTPRGRRRQGEGARSAQVHDQLYLNKAQSRPDWVLRAWRKGRDSNPRKTFAFDGFQDHCLKPLGHPFIAICASACRTGADLAQISSSFSATTRVLQGVESQQAYVFKTSALNHSATHPSVIFRFALGRPPKGDPMLVDACRWRYRRVTGEADTGCEAGHCIAFEAGGREPKDECGRTAL